MNIQEVLQTSPNFVGAWVNVLGATQQYPESIWQKGTGRKIIAAKFPEKINTAKTVVLGGICSLFTAESEAIRKQCITFPNTTQPKETSFANWLSSWYPRIDQVHDAVGVPPKAAKKIIYVCEDSLFAKRISHFTGMDEKTLSKMFREVHEKQGHPVICKWLRQWGYNGQVEVVYTSDIHSQLETALRMWERTMDYQFQNKHRDRALVNIMYTGFWLDVLGITDQAIIYEPINHGLETDFFSILSTWLKNNPYGSTVNKDIGMVGFLPFWSAQGSTRNLPLENVPNRKNWKTFEISDSDIPYYAFNFLPQYDRLSSNEIKERIQTDLQYYYE